MKITSTARLVRLLPFLAVSSVALAGESRSIDQTFANHDSAARAWWGADQACRPPDGLFHELEQVKAPADIASLVRHEIRSEVRDLKRDVRGVRDGNPDSLVKVAFTGARLAGADAGALTAAKFAYQYVTRDPLAPQSTLGEILPNRLSQVPDNTARHVLKSSLRHGFSGDLSGVVAGDLRGQAIELVPATLHSLRLFFTDHVSAELPAQGQS